MPLLNRIPTRGISTTLTSVTSTGPGAGKNWVVGGLTICNRSASIATTIDLTLNDGVNDTYILNNFPLPVGETVVPAGILAKMVMNNGDTLKARVVSGAATIDTVFSYAEEP